MLSFTAIAVPAVFLLSLAGCSSVASRPSENGAGEKTATADVISVAKLNETQELARLARLWERRQQERFDGDYPIGAGDVIEVNVAGMEEIKNVSQRVTGEKTLSLPFVGVINVNGMTDKTLREEIRRRLELDYMRNPQVSLFVKEFRSRQVAVVGAVQKPGLYNLASGSDTIMDMLSQAGGMTTGSAERIVFIPAEPVEPEKAKEIASALPADLLSKDPSPIIMKNSDPIVIDVNKLIRGGNQTYLALPARPGDVIMVPGAGEVLVQGWVEKPGSYKINPGLTVLGAVAAAGGLTFAGDPGAVKVIRTNKDGGKTFFAANLDSIQLGEEPDLPVQEGDVIDVASSGPRLAAYGVYRFFTSIMRVGASANIPIAR
jgi:polysaccharide export outer membrane protein